MIIRQAEAKDALGIARVHVDSWRTTYAGIVSDEFLASLSYEGREKMWRDALSSPASQSFLYVAETLEREIAGFASAGPERDRDENYQGEVYALYLLQSQQRKGIGSLLFRAAARELQTQGHRSLLVWVLQANPSCKFYEALGGEYVREKNIEIGSRQLVEVAYGWKDIQILTGK